MNRPFLIFCLVLFASVYSAQFKYRGFGIFGALTHSAHHYKNVDEDKRENDTNFHYHYPPSHVSKEFFNWGAGVFLELGGETHRWQTELEFANKGAREKELLNAYTGERAGSYTPNKNSYIQWNNYWKMYYPLGGAHWYLMPGIRLEYLLLRSNSAFAIASANFPKFWFSGNIGAGYEVPLFRKLHAFVEYHWNPDIISHTHNSTKVRNRTFELRLGIVTRPKKRGVDDCNAPIYRGPAY